MGFNLDFEGKITYGAPPKNVYAPQACYPGAGSIAMPTKPTKSAQPNELTVYVMPTLPAVPAIPTMPTDLICYAYVTNKKQPLNYNFVADLRYTRHAKEC